MKNFTLSCLATSIEYAKNNLSFEKMSIFMALVVENLGKGGQRKVEKVFGWNRVTIRRGSAKLREEKFQGKDQKETRGRKKSTKHFPCLLEDIKEFADPESQTDPTFQTEKLYTRLTAKNVRKYLLEEKNYKGTRKCRVPCIRTIRNILNEMGYLLKKVQKSKPIKKIPETDKIFEELHKRNREADQDKKTLRLSMDAKAKINIGPFSRRGKNRRVVKAADHDFQPKSALNLWGISLPAESDVFFYFSKSGITSDLIVDCLEKTWKKLRREKNLERIVINLDNGLENSSRRTQFIKRMVMFAYKYNITVSLAYYPPYHSKYNPIERVWGRLEQHWNGELLDSQEKVLTLAKSMTWKEKKPSVEVLKKSYKKGISVSKKIMPLYDAMIERLDGLERWFVDIIPKLCIPPDF